MKTPDEIKKGLELHMGNSNCDGICPYDGYDLREGTCITRLLKDTVAYIQQLENGIDHAEKVAKEAVKSITENLDKLQSRLIQVERERDAAVDALSFGRICMHCVHYVANLTEEPCVKCWFAGHPHKPHWKWRGVCEENTKEK